MGEILVLYQQTVTKNHSSGHYDLFSQVVAAKAIDCSKERRLCCDPKLLRLGDGPEHILRRVRP